MDSFPRRLERTTTVRTRPGLRPSMGFGQPALPWAGLLLDRTCPSSLEDAPPSKEMRWNELVPARRMCWVAMGSQSSSEEAGFKLGPRRRGMVPQETVPMNGAEPKSV